MPSPGCRSNLVISAIHVVLSLVPARFDPGSVCSGELRLSDLQKWLDTISLSICTWWLLVSNTTTRLQFVLWAMRPCRYVIYSPGAMLCRWVLTCGSGTQDVVECRTKTQTGIFGHVCGDKSFHRSRQLDFHRLPPCRYMDVFVQTQQSWQVSAVPKKKVPAVLIKALSAHCAFDVSLCY
jgi:hypothetical protein